MVDEATAEHVTDAHESDDALDARQHLALRVADAVLAAGGLAPSLRRDALEEFGAAGLAELVAMVALFHGFAKLLVVLGLEPEQMPVRLIPLPGERGPA